MMCYNQSVGSGIPNSTWNNRFISGLWSTCHVPGNATTAGLKWNGFFVIGGRK
jgi:hypothetical protein